jgi:hypothetical protein
MRLILVFSLLVVAFIASCSSSPEDLIVGDWKFDHVEAYDSITAADSFLPIHLEVMRKQYQNAICRFEPDGKYVANMNGGPNSEKGTFQLTDSCRSLVTIDEYTKEYTTEVGRLTHAEFGFVQSGVLIVMVRK